MTNHKYTNQLIHTSSPYLLQHAHNPVNWYPWGDEALEKARLENKLIIISIGYAACHWCHVMEHESFEDEEVADVMNTHFVCIKVDREERPDIDTIYMNAVQILTGRGGWPLNAIALPDGRPIFAGTYFRKDHWIQQLMHIVRLSKSKPEEIDKVANHLEKGIRQFEYSGLKMEPAKYDETTLQKCLATLISQTDFKDGGVGVAPKFPMPSTWLFLLRYHFKTGDQQALLAVHTTLQKMAEGGIYDQVGGGFARYAVDGIWKVPHFEKMLYDNGQLVSLYSEAFQASHRPLYKDVVYETLGFIDREMTSPEGGFYASLDADSEGVEGLFYLWKKAELESLLGEDAAWFIELYSVTDEGNWEESNILFIRQEEADVAQKYNMTLQELQVKKQNVKTLLLKERSKRIRPGLDDKILCSWNALMLKGCADAWHVFGEEKFREMALKNARFIKDKFVKKDGRLDRNYKNGKSVINAFLDDYSLAIEAFIAVYQISFQQEWLALANQLADYVFQYFYDENSQSFWYTSSLDKALVARTKEMTDNVIPSSNSSFAKAIYHLGLLQYNEKYISLARKMLENMASNFEQNSRFLTNWAQLLLQETGPMYEVAIVGPEWEKKLREFRKYYLPNVLFTGSATDSNLPGLANRFIEGETWIYVCQQEMCLAPEQEVEAALKAMHVR